MLNSQRAKVGILGLGRMGSAIARVLLREGHEVLAWNRSPPRGGVDAPSIRRLPSVDALCQECDLIISALTGYAAVSSCLAGIQVPHDREISIVNLTSGSADEARSMAEQAGRAGLSYLDGSIWAFPSDIGKTGAVIAYAGSRPCWDKWSPILLALAGGSRFLGADVAAPNLLEGAFPGSFFIGATVLASECLGSLSTTKLAPENARWAMDTALDLLRRMTHQMIDCRLGGQEPTADVTLGICRQALETYAGGAAPSGVMRAAAIEALGGAELEGGADALLAKL